LRETSTGLTESKPALRDSPTPLAESAPVLPESATLLPDSATATPGTATLLPETAQPLPDSATPLRETAWVLWNSAPLLRETVRVLWDSATPRPVTPYARQTPPPAPAARPRHPLGVQSIITTASDALETSIRMGHCQTREGRDCFRWLSPASQ
jgi:hypothetical protein